jgi:hypothetical protein
MTTLQALPDGNWAALVPAEAAALIICHNGAAKSVWIPLTMLDDAPAIQQYLPDAAQRMWTEVQEDTRAS